MADHIRPAGDDPRLTRSYSKDQIKSISECAGLWLMSAASLRNAANHLRGEADWGLFLKQFSNTDGPDATRGVLLAAPVVMLFGMATEGFLKARHIAINPRFSALEERGKWWTSHNLSNLAAKTNYPLIDFSSQDRMLIEDMSLAIQLGRYPVHFKSDRAGQMWGIDVGERLDAISKKVLRDAFSEIDKRLQVEQEVLDRLAEES